jgi:diadenosine tetraphosphate (Ap4A) HIT family hydrolase
MLVFVEDETTTITQKPCVRKSMSFEGEQQKIEHNGSRKKEVFSVHIHVMARYEVDV